MYILRVRSNSVSRDDVPAYTNVTLRSNTTQSTKDISTHSDVQPNTVLETTTSRVKPPAEKPVFFSRSGRCVKLPTDISFQIFVLQLKMNFI